MELEYTTADGRLTVKIEGKTQCDLWQELARFQEVFEENPSATINGKLVTGGDIRYRVRKAKFTDDKGKEQEADYYEKVVVSGPMQWYKKSFGVLNDKSGGLFPQKAPEGMVKGNNNWYKYENPNYKNDSSGKPDIKDDDNVPY